MGDWAAGAIDIECFGTDELGIVRDFLVHEEALFLLTVIEEREQGVYRSRVEMTRDLDQWIRFADFVLPGLPFSMEMLNGDLFVGLGQKQWPGPAYPNPGPPPDPQPESGSVWRID